MKSKKQSISKKQDAIIAASEPKRPRGKPPMGDDARTKGVYVRLSKNELEHWKHIADAAGKSLSQFLLDPIRLMYPATKNIDETKVKPRRKRT